jgi:hypothetical protein
MNRKQLIHTHTYIDKNHNRETRKGTRGFIDETEPPDRSSEPCGSPSPSS